MANLIKVVAKEKFVVYNQLLDRAYAKFYPVCLRDCKSFTEVQEEEWGTRGRILLPFVISVCIKRCLFRAALLLSYVYFRPAWF